MAGIVKAGQQQKHDRHGARLGRLLHPGSIAVIGAKDGSRWSSSIVENLAQHEFAGDLYLVNRRGGEVHGRSALGSIGDLPLGVDLAFVMVPTSAAIDVVKALAKRKVAGVALLTSGFAELGEEGKDRELELHDIACRHGMTILGPNGVGFVNKPGRAVPFGLPIGSSLRAGTVSVVLQSGAVAQSVLWFAMGQNVGINLLVSTGNEVMVRTADVVNYLADDPGTRAIAVFAEGFENPAAFLEAVDRAAEAGKPVIVHKVGRSEVAARAARAHTGAVVGDQAVIDAVLRRHNVIAVDSLEDLILTASLAAEIGPVNGPRLGVVTASGGACEVLADRADVLGLSIPEFDPKTVRRLTDVVPPSGTTQNPLDITGNTVVRPTLWTDAMKIVQADPSIDVVVLVTDFAKESPHDIAGEMTRRSEIAATIRASTKPVLVLSKALTDIAPWARELLSATGHPTPVGGIRDGLTALAHVVRWSSGSKNRRLATSTAPAGDLLVARADRTGVWTERRAVELLARCGVPVVPTVVATDDAQAVAAAHRLGFPVVIKIDGNIAHKSDIGGVALDVRDEQGVCDAVRSVISGARNAGHRADGVLVQPQRSGGFELLVSVISDPDWGQALVIGFGGTWVEILRDSVTRALPASRADIMTALGELRGAELLRGARGTTAVDLEAATRAILAVARAAERYRDDLDTLEVNPLRVGDWGAEALDALVIWRG